MLAHYHTCSLLPFKFHVTEHSRLCTWISLGGGMRWKCMSSLPLSLSLYPSPCPLTWYAMAVLVYIKYKWKKKKSFGSHSPGITLADFCKCSLMHGSYGRIFCHINGSFHVPSSNEIYPTHVCSIIYHWLTFWLEVTNTTGWYPAIRIHFSTLA